MIKKNTRIIFENKVVEDVGGIPLSKGEVITIKTKKREEKFKVIEKLIECQEQGSDLIANITYKLVKLNNK